MTGHKQDMFELIESMREFTGLTAITVVFLVAGGLLVAYNRTVSRKARNAFLGIIIALICITLADWFTFYTSGRHPELVGVHTVLMAATFAVAPGIPVVIAHIIYPHRSVRLMMALVAAHAVFQLVNIFGGFVFWVDDANVYHRGPLYPVYMAAYTITALYLVIESVRAGHAYQTVNIVTVFGILACMLTGVLIQVFDGSVRMTWPAVSMAVILYFLFYSDMVTRTDALTKLLNRRSFEEALAKVPLPCVAVVIDVDDFKNVNDTYGHAFGDECLERVGQMIRRAFGSAGLCYRTGGDEFAVIMTKRLVEADVLKSNLMCEVAQVRQGDERMPSVSVGHSAASEDCSDINAVFEAADHAMYQNKSSK